VPLEYVPVRGIGHGISSLRAARPVPGAVNRTVARPLLLSEIDVAIAMRQAGARLRATERL
jgi:hypothetical protein